MSDVNDSLVVCGVKPIPASLLPYSFFGVACYTEFLCCNYACHLPVGSSDTMMSQVLSQRSVDYEIEPHCGDAGVTTATRESATGYAPSAMTARIR